MREHAKSPDQDEPVSPQEAESAGQGSSWLDRGSCRELVDMIPAVIWSADADASRLIFVSRYAETLFGYPLRSWTDEPTFWNTRMYPKDLPFITASRAEAIRSPNRYDAEYRVVTAEGRTRWVREVGRLVPRSPEPAQLVGVLIDLSQKRSSRGSLAKSNLWLKQIIDTIPQQIWTGAADGTLDFCNARWCNELGLSLDDIAELEGTGWQRVLDPDDRDRVLSAWRNSVAQGLPYEQQERHRTADGQYRWYLCRGVPLRDEQGQIVRWFGTNTDIELQKRAEEELRKSEQRWRAVFENTWVGLALVDPTMHFVDVNAAYQKMIGYTAEELRSMTCLDCTYEGDRPAFRMLCEELQSGKRERFDSEERYRRKDGELVWVRVNGSILPAPTSEARLCVAMVEDITERKRLHDELERDRDWLRLLLDVTHEFIARLEFPTMIDATLSGIEQHGHWGWAVILLPESDRDHLRVYMRRGGGGFQEGATIAFEGSIAGRVYRSGHPEEFGYEDVPSISAEFNRSPWLQELMSKQQFRRGCMLPLIHAGETLGVMFLGTSSSMEKTGVDVELWLELAQLVAAGLHNSLRYHELASSNERLANQRDCIEEQIRTAYDFEDIVGRSEALRRVLEQVRTVAPTDSAVLIVGETGTGKELIARAIHDLSPRRGQPFLKLDCAAIPATLLESELFGHERGAFTGAVAQKLGRFEIANRGTVFLDEVGEIPLELQVKLLRVLQDQTFERLGSNRTVHLDVRVIAATNCNLEERVSKGEFRADLYYRLKVFPITIPPLRERPDDIPPLVWHYLRKYSQRMRKAIDTIPPGAMDVFTRYPWPGNVRELQHFIERCVVLTSGSVLRLPLKELEQVIRKRKGSADSQAPVRTLEQIEREAILQALREANWVVGGPHGAAARLGMKRTTLASRMEKLGIRRR